MELNDGQRRAIYDEERRKYTVGDIEAALLERFDLTVELTKEELERATDYALGIQDSEIYYMDMAEKAINKVLDERNKEAPDTYYAKVLEMYGLRDGQPFKIRGIDHLIYHFDDGDLLCAEALEGKRAEPPNCTLAQFLFLFKKEDIELVKAPKPQQPELLNETLKKIGLETNQFFRINDDEFSGHDFYIDSIGDVYIINGHPNIPDDRDPEMDEQHEFLTLGRILTQYPDKIVPWDTKETGYA